MTLGWETIATAGIPIAYTSSNPEGVYTYQHRNVRLRFCPVAFDEVVTYTLVYERRSPATASTPHVYGYHETRVPAEGRSRWERQFVISGIRSVPQLLRAIKSLIHPDDIVKIISPDDRPRPRHRATPRTSGYVM